MDERDGRKIDRKALEEIRIRAVKRVEAGESPEVVTKALGLTRPRIYEWIAKYREGGIDALRRRTTPGKVPKLAGHHLKKIYKLVVGADPRQLKFEFALWTRGMIRELIMREFGVRLSEGSVGRCSVIYCLVKYWLYHLAPFVRILILYQKWSTGG
jgi:transposase